MTEQKNRRFLKGMLIYAGLLLLLMAAALLLLNSYLKVYEETRPETAMRAYWDSLATEGPSAACLAALSDLDANIVAPADALSFASALLQDASYRESIAENGEDQRVYSITADSRVIGRVTLRHSGKTRYGLTGWAVTGEEFDFSTYFGSAGVTVPTDYSVWLDGVRLDERYVTDSAVAYESLQPYYDSLSGLPYQRHYEVDGYIDGAALRVLDTEGREVPPEEQNELHYLDNCSPDEKAQLNAFATIFLDRYIGFTANIEQTYAYSYSDLAWLVVPGSSLGARLQRAVTDGWWSNTIACTLEDFEIHFITNLGDNGWLIDLSYETRTSTRYDTVTDDYNIRLLIVDYNGSLRASALYNY